MSSIWPRVNTVLLTLVLLALVALIGMVAMRAEGGPLDPPGPPGSTDTSVELPGNPISGPINITASGHYYLTQDIRVSGNVSGIVISVNDVSIDLGGFTIDGSDTASTYGIIAFGRDNLTIRNGMIRDFNFGIDASGSSNVVIDGVHVYSNFRGVSITTGEVTNCNVSGNGETGIYNAGPSGGVTIRECVISENGATGVHFNGCCNLLERSHVRGNNTANGPDWFDLVISEGSGVNAVRDNVFGSRLQYNIWMFTGHVLTDNVCLGFGIDYGGSPGNPDLPDHANPGCDPPGPP